jgi:phenylalanyl-tRNA synthetase beta chain
MCLIARTTDGPTSIAGVMGGAARRVAAQTTRGPDWRSATWNGPEHQRTSTRLALRTEASRSVEKQLLAGGGDGAQALAAEAHGRLCGAPLVRREPSTPAAPGRGERREPILLRDATSSGCSASPCRRPRAPILERLGFGVAPADGGLAVSVPHWRRDDVTREADLVEEVARIHGLDALPATLPSRRGASGGSSRAATAPPRRGRARRLRLSEAVGWSFTSPDAGRPPRAAAGDARRDAVTLANPMSEDQSVLRTTLLGSLLDLRAAQPGARAWATCACSSAARSTDPP